ncbi:MAG: hypothetical protein OXK76_05780 [Gammaproteobacteria bacterium]|nr:hypothetical protein [Gammaproteobacteria bacterium]
MRDVTAFSVGDIIKTSFAVYFSNLPVFVPLAFIAFVPVFAVVLIPESSSVNNPFVLPDPNAADPQAAMAELGAFYLVMGREFLVAMLCTVWLQAGYAFGVVRHLRGGSTGFAETFVQSVRMLGPALLVAVVVGIGVGIGSLLFLVPGIIIALVLWVAVPAAVVERSGLGALGRSAELTRGFKGQIFGLALILFMFQVVAVLVVAMVASALTDDLVVVFILEETCVIVLSGILATATSVTYHDLRVLREGVDTRAISQVFE